MKWFLNNLVLVHVLTVFLLYSFLGGGTRGEWLKLWAPWLTLATLQALMLFPQQKKSENLFQARARAWAGFFRDPLLWLSLGLALLLGIQALNGPRQLVYLKETLSWIYSAPPVSWLPSCVKPSEATCVLWWFAPALAAVLAAKHGLLKRSKRLLLELMCWSAGVLSLLGILQYTNGSSFLHGSLKLPSHFFASFGYPNFAAAYFVLATTICIGIAIWYRDNDRDERAYQRNTILIPLLLNAIGATLSLSRAGILFLALTILILGGYFLIRSWKRLGKGSRYKVYAIVTALLLISVALLGSAHKNPTVEEIRTTDWTSFFSQRMTGNYQVQCALDMWQDYRCFGCGGWGYPHLAYQYLPREEWKQLRGTGQANIHNDAVQFLCEHGIVGLGLMLAILAGLLVPMSCSWWRSTNQIDTTAIRAIPWAFRFNAVSTAMLWATAVILIHSTFDIPFRSPAVLMLYIAGLALAQGYDIKRYVNESVH
ncbi:MAG: O-antigen ligase family protein [Kiritimatiellia bacterium]